jgi:hypothetical protein
MSPTVRLGSLDFRENPVEGLLRQGKYEEFYNVVKVRRGKRFQTEVGLHVFSFRTG